ncbi:MAG: iron-sulfur cluster repair protein YtfE [Gemmatimonadota bacterium]
MNTVTSPVSQATSRRLSDLPLGQIARQLSGASAVFRRYGLDFCCGGADTLRAAAKERGLDVNEIERALHGLDAGSDTAPTEARTLIDHILTRYHDTHRRELPELIELAQRVEAVHQGHPDVPRGLAAMLRNIAAELDAHMQKEEQVLFPMMRAGGTPMIVHPIAMMQHEHVEHGERLRRLETLTRGHVPPADACTSWIALYAGTRKLVDDVMQHIHLENNVLFPQFGQPDF